MSFSSLMQICMNSFGISTVTTYISSSTPTIHVSRTYLVATVGDIASSLDIKSLCVLPPATFLPFRVPSLSSLRKIWDSRIVFLCYSFKYFLCIGVDVSLIWSFFISEWVYHLPLFPYFLRTDLSESRIIMTSITSGSLWNDPWFNNTVAYLCRTSCPAIFVAEYAYQFPDIIGV